MSSSPHLTSRQRWLTLSVVALGVFVTALDNSIVNVALPSIQRDLHLDLAGVAWIVNGYILAYAMLLLTAGRLADVFGRRRVFLVGVAVFTAASLAAGLAQTVMATRERGRSGPTWSPTRRPWRSMRRSAAEA